jgi:prepilin-type N-terminal cleavage/methylation domain-containing protein
MKGLSNNRGFTLVEVLVVMAISTILLGVLIGIIVSGNKQYTRIKKEDETFSELQMVRKAITNELKSNNKSVKLDEKLDEDYHKLWIGDYYIAFNKESKILTINSKEFNFKYIEDIYYNRYSTSNLLIIFIDYGKEVPYKIYFSCMNLEDTST